MKKDLQGRISVPVSELREAEGRWEIISKFDSKVRQDIFMSGLIQEPGYKAILFPLEIHSCTHKLLRPALLADARVDLVSNEECELVAYFTKQVSPLSIVSMELTSRRRGTLEDDARDRCIEIEIPVKGVKSQDMFLGATFLRGLRFLEQFRIGAPVMR